MEIIPGFVLAILIDLILGEPPAAVHPVVWIGKVISLLSGYGLSRGRRIQFVLGCFIVLCVLAIFVTPVYFLIVYLRDFNIVVYIIVSAIVLKTTFSLRGLRQAALTVRKSLQLDNPEKARFELRALVGRNTGKLDEKLMVSATVESVAENTCDSFVAPLFYFLFLGVAGAVAYRVINTLDAMIGHHGKFEYLGKFAAHLDSAANYIPARITAMLIIFAAWILRRNTSGAWRIMWRDRGKTESPNAGWTMSAIAGALDVQLEKNGCYRLGDNVCDLNLSKIDDALRIIMAATLIWSTLIVLIEAVHHVIS